MADIFISYARKDLDWVRPLAVSLEAHGWTVWWDRRIPAGKTFRQVIDKELAEARCVVVVWSAEALRSNWVVEEADDGLQRRILVPVFKETVTPPRGFRGIQCADLSQWKDDQKDEQFQNFIGDVSALIGEPTPQESKPEVVKPRATKARARVEPEERAVAPARLSERVLDFPVPAFVSVPAGKFKMGSSDNDIEAFLAKTDWGQKWAKEGWFNSERPQHIVELAEFRIAKYPVTNAEYGAFVQDARQRPPSHWSGNHYSRELATHPVTHVDWGDVVAYCKRLTARLREARQLRAGEVIRLPTEAEWEKTARGTDGRLYPWGNDWAASNCNTAEGGVKGTTPVGKYSPAGDSPYGACDTVGNVSEWCADYYGADYYTQSPKVNPTGPEKGSGRVLRGGSWNNYALSARCADRDWYDPVGRNDDIGFRVVASPF